MPPQDIVKNGSTGPIIEIRKLVKNFGELPVLQGISMFADPGEVIALLGPSGSGKSTLLRCINFLDTPDKGRILFKGVEIRTKAVKKGGRMPCDRKQVERMRTRVAMIFQQFNLWSHKSILENVIEAPVHVLKRHPKEARETARYYLEKVGIYDKRACYPAQLSGGQQQRAAIARALAMEPEVMLFDEPTSSLDPERVGEVLQVMRQLANEGRTMIVVTHEIGFAREIASRVIFLNNGIIEDQGPAPLLFKQPRSERFRQFLESMI